MSDFAVTLNDDNFEKEVLKSDKPVLVDFWAAWCMPCQMLAPIFEELAEANKEKVKFGKLNTDENAKTASQYQIMNIPAVLIFKDGKVVDQLLGVQPKDVYEKAIKGISN